ncbi:hypothetical protein [Borreliella turdi]|uniref:hypothetical protein n=1 Tax=Borreliella turdi TaxID=57863 RepID=UPI001562CEA8|nr:hypothetical protein [Borreliella turdi]
MIKIRLIKFGKDKAGNGSVAHYIQNMELVAYYKEIIWKHLVELLEKNFKMKK